MSILKGFEDVKEYNKKKKTRLVIDPSISGISGDMFVGALLDLCQNDSKARNKIDTLLMWLQEHDKTFKINISRRSRKGITGTSVQTQTTKKDRFSPLEIDELIRRFLASVDASNDVLEFSISTLALILQAESKIHNLPPEEVHLHETGSVDTVFDICGAGLLLHHIGAFEKKSEIKGSYRLRDLVYLAGENKTETVHKENNCVFHLDIKTSFFSPRLVYERRRISESNIQENEVIVEPKAYIVLIKLSLNLISTRHCEF